MNKPPGFAVIQCPVSGDTISTGFSVSSQCVNTANLPRWYGSKAKFAELYTIEIPQSVPKAVIVSIVECLSNLVGVRGKYVKGTKSPFVLIRHLSSYEFGTFYVDWD